MNQNYFPQGLNDNQLRNVDTLCIEYIKNECDKVEGGDTETVCMYRNSFQHINFVVTKGVELKGGNINVNDKCFCYFLCFFFYCFTFCFCYFFFISIFSFCFFVCSFFFFFC
eukprot:348556_1